ncbi:MAG: hypothetical protein KJ623_00055 [Nanoarchaeota archaeon]|nr:hypothetical protein [Nanoarchaeota archaeon]MBU0962359.1 hypothetical protein [Nanoarchaeota archaeon]
MPILGFNITKINAEKKNEVNQKVDIASDLKISKVSEEKVFLDKAQTALRFDFDFIVNYNPNIGTINLSGFILYVEGEESAKKILDSWKKNKTIEPDLMEKLFNSILLRCNIKTLLITQELNLPPHVRLPMVVAEKESKEIKNKKDNYIG